MYELSFHVTFYKDLNSKKGGGRGINMKLERKANKKAVFLNANFFFFTFFY